jgi:hypothetical protein
METQCEDGRTNFNCEKCVLFTKCKGVIIPDHRKIYTVTATIAERLQDYKRAKGASAWRQ